MINHYRITTNQGKFRIEVLSAFGDWMPHLGHGSFTILDEAKFAKAELEKQEEFYDNKNWEPVP